MFINFFIIAFFKCLNFAIVLCLMAFVYKKYAFPLIANLMMQKEHETLSLIQQKALLEQQQIGLDELMHKDFLLYENIKIKMGEWNKALTEKQIIQEQTNKRKVEAFIAKKIKQETLLKETHIKKHIAKQASCNIEKNLTEYFEKNNNGLDYLDAIITTIHEKKP